MTQKNPVRCADDFTRCAVEPLSALNERENLGGHVSVDGDNDCIEAILQWQTPDGITRCIGVQEDAPFLNRASVEVDAWEDVPGLPAGQIDRRFICRTVAENHDPRALVSVLEDAYRIAAGFGKEDLTEEVQFGIPKIWRPSCEMA